MPSNNNSTALVYVRDDETVTVHTTLLTGWLNTIPELTVAADGVKEIPIVNTLVSTPKECTFVCRPGAVEIGDTVRVHLPELHAREYTVSWIDDSRARVKADAMHRG